MKRKWEIDKLKVSKQFKRTANTILESRIKSLLIYVDKYFKDLSVKSLHDVRIALRRVRYSMELFIVCYDKKKYLKLYNIIQKLQDSSGNVRDVDISLENINTLTIENQIEIDSKIITKANEKKVSLEEIFRVELAKFASSNVLKDFLKQLS
ncbi:MAG: CHAD domain-containing protein [Ignavibacteriales bacterium]|nr:CHAD domain-containing protein [Ignavibacteriales bacterium]